MSSPSDGPADEDDGSGLEWCGQPASISDGSLGGLVRG